MSWVIRLLGLVVVTGVLLGSTPVNESLRLEVRAARLRAARIEKEWPLRGGGTLAEYVRTLGDRLGRAAGTSPFPWSFILFRNRNLRAYSIGEGRIYISDGSLTQCDDEAELAAVIAHEMAHQLAGHFRDGPTEAPQRDDKNVEESLHQLEKELEADRLSIPLLRAAGYNPHAALSILARATNSGSAGDNHARRDALRIQLRDIPNDGQLDSEEFQRLRATEKQPATGQ